MLAAFVFYGWPALLTLGFSGNPALCYYWCLIAMIVVYLSQINIFFFFFDCYLVSTFTA